VGNKGCWMCSHHKAGCQVRMCLLLMPCDWHSAVLLRIYCQDFGTTLAGLLLGVQQNTKNYVSALPSKSSSGILICKRLVGGADLPIARNCAVLLSGDCYGKHMLHFLQVRRSPQHAWSQWTSPPHFTSGKAIKHLHCF